MFRHIKIFVVGVSVIVCALLLVVLYWSYTPLNKKNGTQELRMVNTEYGQIESLHLKQKMSDRQRESENFKLKLTGRAGKTSLTRLGSSLLFDSATCPSDSILSTSRLRNSEPLHDDCPTLFIVGARKGGTTSLYNYISRHPDFKGIFLNKRPGIGETFFFASGRYLNSMSWEDYVKLFPPRDVAMSGDASVGNLVQCQVPQRIFTACGKAAKVVMLFRDPLVRFVSNVLFRHNTKDNLSVKITQELKRMTNKDGFQTFVKATDEDTMIKKWPSLVCLFGQANNLVFEGLYYVHLLNWLCNFPPENILIINSEEFFSEPSVILDQVVQFLGLKSLTWDEYDTITKSVYNKGNYTQDTESHKLSIQDKQKLLEVYEPFNKALLKLLDWPLTSVNWEH